MIVIKFEPTTPIRSQHVATRRKMMAKRAQHVAPNNVAICCDRSAGSLNNGNHHRDGICPILISRDFFRILFSFNWEDISNTQHSVWKQFQTLRSSTNLFSLFRNVVTDTPSCLVYYTGNSACFSNKNIHRLWEKIQITPPPPNEKTHWEKKSRLISDQIV